MTKKSDVQGVLELVRDLRKAENDYVCLHRTMEDLQARSHAAFQKKSEECDRLQAEVTRLHDEVTQLRDVNNEAIAKLTQLQRERDMGALDLIKRMLAKDRDFWVDVHGPDAAQIKTHYYELTGMLEKFAEDNDIPSGD